VLNVAVTFRGPLIVTLQAPVPVQSPLQPANTIPLSGVGVSETSEPPAKVALQVEPQLMPAGDEVTVPVPVPALVTVSVWGVCVAKVATAVLAALMVSVQVPVPEQSPLQPLNIMPLSGVAVRVTTVLVLKVVLQVAPQLMPAGDEVTVPVPVPDFCTVSVWGVPPELM
jgi:hypothetical protein